MIKINGDENLAFKISKWLQDKGYKHEVDYRWHKEVTKLSFDPFGTYRYRLVFECKDPQIETLIALTWG